MGLRPEHIILGVAMFSLIMFFGTSALVDVSNSYNVSLDETDELFNPEYNQFNTTYATGLDMKNKTLDAETLGGDESWESMTKSSYSAIRESKNSFSLIGIVSQAISRKLGVDPIFANTLMIFLSVSLSMFIIYTIFRFKAP